MEDLRELGVRLQHQLGMTVDRLNSIKSPDLRRRTLHVLDRGQYMFKTLSTTVQTTERLRVFMEKSFGVTLEDIFSMAGGGEYAVRVSAKQAMMLVNDGIALTLEDLVKINREIDKEHEHDGEKKTEPATH